MVNIDPDKFLHPLAKAETIQTDRGEREVVNNWGFASTIWVGAVLDCQTKCLDVAAELFELEGNAEKFQSLYDRSAIGDDSAIREALNILANAIEEKIDRAFKDAK